MEIGWLLFGFFLFVTMIFIAVAFFLPEWVGITGKKAQQLMKEHEQDGSANGAADASFERSQESKNQ